VLHDNAVNNPTAEVASGQSVATVLVCRVRARRTRENSRGHSSRPTPRQHSMSSLVSRPYSCTPAGRPAGRTDGRECSPGSYHTAGRAGRLMDWWTDRTRSWWVTAQTPDHHQDRSTSSRPLVWRRSSPSPIGLLFAFAAQFLIVCLFSRVLVARIAIYSSPLCRPAAVSFEYRRSYGGICRNGQRLELPSRKRRPLRTWRRYCCKTKTEIVQNSWLNLARPCENYATVSRHALSSCVYAANVLRAALVTSMTAEQRRC